MGKDLLYSDTPYDDAFRTIESECDDVLIDFVNYFFHMNYKRNVKVRRLQNEQLIEHDDMSLEKRITDSNFEILSGSRNDSYHLECESKKYDGTILIRMFRYNAQIARSNSESGFEKLTVHFPRAGILLLRNTKSTPSEAEIEIETPGGNVTYPVEIIREIDFDMDTIFAKRLYFLLPFYIFNYESELKRIDADAEQTEHLVSIFRKMQAQLAEEVETGRLSSYSYGVIIRVTERVVYNLASGHKNVQEKVGEVMGGKVMDLDIIRMKHEADERLRMAVQEVENRSQEEKQQVEERALKAEAEVVALKKEVEELRMAMATV